MTEKKEDMVDLYQAITPDGTVAIVIKDGNGQFVILNISDPGQVSVLKAVK